MKANKARATKAVSGKDAGYDDLGGRQTRGAIVSSKAGNNIARRIIVKASLEKFEHLIAAKAAVKDKVKDGGAACTNTRNHAGTNICANNTTMVITPVKQ